MLDAPRWRGARRPQPRSRTRYLLMSVCAVAGVVWTLGVVMLAEDMTRGPVSTSTAGRPTLLWYDELDANASDS